MNVRGVTPILNVSNIVESFDWFTRLGWQKLWDWCPGEDEPVTCGAVGNGKSEVFLCQGA